MSTISSSITKGGWEDGSTAQAVESKEDGSTKISSSNSQVSMNKNARCSKEEWVARLSSTTA